MRFNWRKATQVISACQSNGEALAAQPQLAKGLSIALPCIVMKRLFAIAVLLLVFVVRVHAGADDDYVQIYTLIQEGDSLETSRPTEALAKFTEAQTDLQRFQRIYPGWNDRVVNFRLNYIASKIVILSGGKAAATNASVVANKTPQSSQNKPSPPAQTVAAPVQPKPVAQTPAQFPPATETPIQSPPVVQAPIQTPIVLQPKEVPSTAVFPPPQPSPVSELQSQIADLQNQLKRLQDDKTLLEAKLREALAARPASVDPRELAKAQDQLRMIQKENDLLKVTLSQQQQKANFAANSNELAQVRHELSETKRQLAEQTARASQLSQENASLKSQIKTLSANADELASLRTENQILKTLAKAKPGAAAPVVDADTVRQLADAKARIAALESDKEVWRLEKIALQNRVKELSVQTAPWTGDSEHVKQLERERDELQQKLETAERKLYGRNGKAIAAQVDQLAEQLETLRARMDVYESKAVPYSPEELALFNKPDAPVTDPHAGEKSVQELPVGTVQLVSEAQQDFSNRSYQQAEQKYLEVLKHDNKNPSALANLAAIQLEMGHYDDAEKNVGAALASAPNDSYSLSILGNLKFRQEKYDDALNALSRAAKIDPKNAEIQNFLGLALSEKGMRSAAETAFRKAIILKPDYGGAQNNLAVFYLTQNPPSVELARWHYGKAVAAGFPRNPDLEKMLEEKEAAEPGR